ncbi:hypothetical protein GA0070611_1388 [Micromonospora auratinigra]|uniref:Uncharacterized protein n=1 Tax=Micromonospora auratinigra TaxID=261654 RepID=A0A1A8ZAC0_9ACTN|nr:hypothetical protein GA0070611_1388 [Micromonospora auratinigra]
MNVTHHILDRVKARLPDRVDRANDLLGKALVATVVALGGLLLATLIL